jgi:hypothetical protein
MAEVHLHPADMRGAIVSMSAPAPPESWRWGGPDWEGGGAGVGAPLAGVGAPLAGVGVPLGGVGAPLAGGAMADAAVVGVTVAVAEVPAVSARWETVLGGLPGISFVSDPEERGPVEIRLRADRGFDPFEVGSVRITGLSR